MLQLQTAGSAPGIDDGANNDKRGWMSLDRTVKWTDKPKNMTYREEAKLIWKKLDANSDGTVDETEIEQWLVKSGLLSAVSKEDQKNVVRKLFNEIDRDRNGTLDREEFIRFFKMVQIEKAQMLHASRHHITSLPPSIVKFNQKQFTTEAIELLLQEKIQQFTSQDSDRFRQVLVLFRTQVQRSKDHENADNKVMGVTKLQFTTVLSWLGIFSTKEQAEALFDKYDENGDGILTVHEFLKKARAVDYPGRRINVGEKYSFRTGRRMFLEDTLNSRPVRPATPNDDVFHVSPITIAERIRTRMGNAPGTSQHYNETPLALNDLMKVFRFYDQEHPGRKRKKSITVAQLSRALGELNISLGDTHLLLLMDNFPAPDGNFDYEKFCFFVYPGKPQNATLPHHTSLQLRKFNPDAPTRNMSTLDFSRTNGGFAERSSRVSTRRSHQSREMSARLAHSQRLKPLSASGRRSLAPSASVTNLPRSRGSSRGLSRSSSQPQFNAAARSRGRTPYA